MRTPLWWLAAAVLLGGYLAVRHYYGGAGTLAIAFLDPGCPADAKALAAPTLGEMYDHALSLARRWKQDAVVVRLDNLAMQGPLQPNGSSTMWTAGFYSPGAKSGFMVHTGDGRIFCSHHGGESVVPKLEADFMRDGAALYAIAEKNGREYLDKGRGVGVVLWTTGEGRTSWILEYVDAGGNSADTHVVVDANTGKLQEVRK